MLNEPASSLRDPRPYVPPIETPAAEQAPPDERLESVRALVSTVMDVQAEREPSSLRPEDALGGAILLMIREAKLLIRFDGRLLVPSEAAYDQLDSQFRPLGLTPVFREANDGTQFVYVIEGRSRPAPTGWIWNAVLLFATFLSVLYVGKLFGWNEQLAALSDNPFEYGRLLARIQEAEWYTDLHVGIPYAFAILLILGAHELGHYFAARRRNHAASLPFFIPFPFGIFGTFGAFIQLREPMRNRKVLLEVGAAGPLAGLIFAVPILFIGLATSTIGPLTPGGLSEGNSLFYMLSKFLVFGRILPGGGEDVFVNSLAWAGWTGLFVTGLNLLPMGQLDGGHVLYSLVGERAKRLYWPLVAGMGILTLLNDSLLFIFVLLLLFGRAHAVPLDNITPLGQRHRWVAIGTLIIFILVFVPLPLTQNAPVGAGGGGGFTGTEALAALTAGVIVLAQRLRR